MVAAGRADHAAHMRPLALQAFHVDQPAAHLEGAGRRVVLVLHPDLGAAARRQQRPGVVRRRREGGVHQTGGSLERGQVEQTGLRNGGRRRAFPVPPLSVAKGSRMPIVVDSSQWTGEQDDAPLASPVVWGEFTEGAELDRVAERLQADAWFRELPGGTGDDGGAARPRRQRRPGRCAGRQPEERRSAEPAAEFRRHRHGRDLNGGGGDRDRHRRRGAAGGGRRGGGRRRGPGGGRGGGSGGAGDRHRAAKRRRCRPKAPRSASVPRRRRCASRRRPSCSRPGRSASGCRKRRRARCRCGAREPGPVVQRLRAA